MSITTGADFTMWERLIESKTSVFETVSSPVSPVQVSGNSVLPNFMKKVLQETQICLGHHQFRHHQLFPARFMIKRKSTGIRSEHTVYSSDPLSRTSPPPSPPAPPRECTLPLFSTQSRAGRERSGPTILLLKQFSECSMTPHAAVECFVNPVGNKTIIT